MGSTGQTWVLLRGLMREQRHWGAFVELLAKAFPQHQVVTLDLPGNGLLHQRASPWRVSALSLIHI